VDEDNFCPACYGSNLHYTVVIDESGNKRYRVVCKNCFMDWYEDIKPYNAELINEGMPT